MYYKLKSNVLFRKYETYGYITDDRNYRYIKDNIIGERIVSESGAVFLSSLSKTPKSLGKICTIIQEKYPETELNLIKNDVQEFFSELVFDGFICKGATKTECNDNDYAFSYEKISSKVEANVNEDEDDKNSTPSWEALLFD